MERRNRLGPPAGVEVLFACKEQRSQPTLYVRRGLLDRSGARSRLLGPAAVLELSAAAARASVVPPDLCFRNGRGACAHLARFLPTDRLKLYALAEDGHGGAPIVAVTPGAIPLGGSSSGRPK